MAKTIGSFDLASLKYLRDDVTQYFWFESDSSSAWGSGAHVTLYPESQFTDSTNPNYMKGQNIIMNTDGFSIRNGGLPMMVLDNDSLDFNAVDTSLGTYTKMATFGLIGMQIYSRDSDNNLVQLANIGYGEGASQSGIAVAPYYTFGTRNGGTPEQIGNYSVVEGLWNTASGSASHAEGQNTYAIGHASHAEGDLGQAQGLSSHVEGYHTIASGKASHAEGHAAKAFGHASHASGQDTKASAVLNNVIGRYNEEDAETKSLLVGYYVCDGTESQRGRVSVATTCLESVSTNISVLYNGVDITASMNVTIMFSSTVSVSVRQIVSPYPPFNAGDKIEVYTSAFSNYAFIIGNGNGIVDDPSERSNALTVDWSGRVECGDHVGNLKSIFDIFYPKGSYYETSLTDAIPSGGATPIATDLANLGVTWFNPNYAWGGTWVLETSGQVHVSAGTGYSINHADDNNGVGTSDGGSASVTLNTTQIPAHTHGEKSLTGWFQNRRIGGTANSGTIATGTSGIVTGSNVSGQTSTVNAGTHSGVNSTTHSRYTINATHTHTSVGGNGAHENRPPFIIVNRWHRAT